MGQIFEDAFMDAQASLISLCKELKNDADKIYVYCSIESGYEFNVFYQKQGKVLRLSANDLNVSRELISRFLDYGLADTKKIDAVCKEYGKPTPTEIKMIYDVKTRKFDAEYQYKPVQTMDRGFVDILESWIDEINSTCSAPSSAEPPKQKPKFPFFCKK